jgi:hypothetical protein
MRMQAVADWNVDEPVLSTNRHGGLRACGGEGKQTRPLAAAKDDRERIDRHQHVVVQSTGRRVKRRATVGS